MDVAVSTEVEGLHTLLEAARELMKLGKDDPMMQEELLYQVILLTDFLSPPSQRGLRDHLRLAAAKRGLSPERREVQLAFFQMVDDWNSLIRKELNIDISQRPRVLRAVNIIIALIETADESAFEPMREGDNG